MSAVNYDSTSEKNMLITFFSCNPSKFYPFKNFNGFNKSQKVKIRLIVKFQTSTIPIANNFDK